MCCSLIKSTPPVFNHFVSSMEGVESTEKSPVARSILQNPLPTLFPRNEVARLFFEQYRNEVLPRYMVTDHHLLITRSTERPTSLRFNIIDGLFRGIAWHLNFDPAAFDSGRRYQYEGITFYVLSIRNVMRVYPLTHGRVLGKGEHGTVFGTIELVSAVYKAFKTANSKATEKHIHNETSHLLKLHQTKLLRNVQFPPEAILNYEDCLGYIGPEYTDYEYEACDLYYYLTKEKYAKFLTTTHRLNILLQVVQGIKSLYELDALPTDLKPENILMHVRANVVQVFVGDLMFSPILRFRRNEKSDVEYKYGRFMHTYEYTHEKDYKSLCASHPSEESLKRKIAEHCTSTLGCVCFAILTRRLFPFNNPPQSSGPRRFITSSDVCLINDYRSKLTADYPPAIVTMIERMLVTRDISLEEVFDIVEGKNQNCDLCLLNALL